MTDRRSLYSLVFLAGVGTLATEIAASRLLAPYFGNSTVVWANVIGLVLASLSLGYWLGGKLADRRPDPRVLGGVVAGAAVLVALTPFVARPFLDLTVEGLDEVSTGAAIGSFFGVLILFAPPVVLLGMVAPFAIRLGLERIESAGAVAGRLYAVSTIGSLVGTFLSALVAIPLIGTQRTLLASAALLALAAALAALLVLPPGAVKAGAGVLHEDESLYQFVQVTERSGARRLYLDEGVAVHSVWRPGEVLTGGVWDTFLVLPPLLGRPLEKVAILGNAGGTTARAMGVYYPDAEIDGVELDSAVTKAGRRYLGLGDNPRLTVHTADARPFLRRSAGGYDLIVVDAYRPPYVPFYLATREFFELVRKRLAPGGIVALNVASVPGDTRLARAIATTLAAELPSVWTWQALRFNQIVIALERPLPKRELVRRLRAVTGDLAPLTRLAARDLRPGQSSGDPWTDDHAPVEWITDRMIVEYAAEGGRLDETPLPTAPR